MSTLFLQKNVKTEDQGAKKKEFLKLVTSIYWPESPFNQAGEKLFD